LDCAVALTRSRRRSMSFGRDTVFGESSLGFMEGFRGGDKDGEGLGNGCKGGVQR
jgi:hypothetical protein